MILFTFFLRVGHLFGNAFDLGLYGIAGEKQVRFLENFLSALTEKFLYLLCNGEKDAYFVCALLRQPFTLRDVGPNGFICERCHHSI